MVPLLSVKVTVTCEPLGRARSHRSLRGLSLYIFSALDLHYLQTLETVLMTVILQVHNHEKINSHGKDSQPFLHLYRLQLQQFPVHSPFPVWPLLPALPAHLPIFFRSISIETLSQHRQHSF